MISPNIDDTAPPSPIGLAGWIAWVLILLVAGFLVLGNEYPELRGRKAQPATSPLQMNLIGKYVVGMSQLTKQSGTQLLAQADDKAETNGDKIDIAILAGEVAGKAEALKRLEAIPSPATRKSLEVVVPAGVVAAATQTAAALPDAPASRPVAGTADDDANAASTESAQRSALTRLYTDGPDSMSDPQRNALKARDDFFGRLALSFGKPDGDPQRAAVLHDARFAAVVFLVFIVLIIVLGGIGLVLLVLAIVFYCTGALKTRFQPQPQLKPVFVEIFAAYLLLFVAGSLAVALLGGSKLGLNAAWVITPIVPLAMGWGVVRGLTWREVLHGLGWFGGSRFFIEAPLGIVGYVAGLPIVAIGLGLSLLIARFTHATPSHPIQNSFSTATAWQLYGLAAVWAPIVEETFFRGALFNHLRQRWNWLVSAPIVAFIFAAIHPQGLTFIPALGSIAIVLAAIREWRGTIISSMVAHGLNNATVVTLMLLTM